MAEKAKATIIKVDFTGVTTGGGRVHIPEGDYGVEITKVVSKKGNDSGKPYLEATFKVIKGDKKGMGKTLYHNLSLQKQSLWNLRNLLESCGKQVPSKAVNIDLGKLPKQKCAATVSDEEYEGKKKSVITAFFPLSDLGRVSSSGDELEADAEETEETEETAEEVEEEAAAEEEEELFS